MGAAAGVAGTVAAMKIRALTRPNTALAAAALLASAAVQLVLERRFPRLGRLARGPLAAWLGSVVVSGAGVAVAVFGPVAFVGGRLVRRSHVDSVRYWASPSVVGRRPRATVLLSSGRTIPLDEDPFRTADVLGVPAVAF